MKPSLRKVAAIGLVVVLCCATPAVQASTFYVGPGGNNSNSGTSPNQPWATLQFAANSVSAGDTVHVLPGNYVGFDLRKSGTATQPISFLAQPGAVIHAVNPVTTRDGINVENASHIVIDGFTLNSPNPNTRAGIRVVGDGFGFVNGQFSRSVVVRNNTVTNWGTWGIFTGFAHDLLIENNRTSGAINEHGIYVSNSGDRPVIRNNRIFHNYANGIHMNGDIFTGNPSVSPDVDGVISDALVENNIIFGNGAGGGSGINGDGVVNARIVNNLLYDNHASGVSLYQIDGGAPSTGGEIINNTIINASDARWAINLRHGATGATVFNNILFNLNGSNRRGSIAALEGSNVGLISDYNLLDPRFSLVDGGIAIGLAAWIASTGNDQNSLALTFAQMQALFADYAASDFTLSETSAARDFGVSSLLNGGFVDAPLYDLAGMSRPMGSGFDVGAYEFLVPPICDFNSDGLCTLTDLNGLLALGPVAPGVPATGNELFDLNDDGVINNDDVEAWLAAAATANGLASPYQRGDGNLDGVVDGSDFNLWNSNKFTQTLQWDRGDFNGDGATDGSDFNVWNTNKFVASDARWSVPESSGLAWLLLVFASRVAQSRK